MTMVNKISTIPAYVALRLVSEGYKVEDFVQAITPLANLNDESITSTLAKYYTDGFGIAHVKRCVAEMVAAQQYIHGN